MKYRIDRAANQKTLTAKDQSINFMKSEQQQSYI